MERTETFTQLTGFGRPFGLAIDGVGRFYICDMDLHSVARLSPDLAQVSWLATDGTGWMSAEAVKAGTAARARPRKPQLLNGPHSVAVTDTGAAWVTTYYTPGLHIIDKDGRHRETFTSLGDTSLAGPATAKLDRAGRLLITEFSLHCVLITDRAGNKHGALGSGARDGLVPHMKFSAGSTQGAFDRPHMTTELADGSYVVADTWNHRLQLYDTNFIWRGWLGAGCESWCDDARVSAAGSGPGWLSAPVAVGAAPDGRFIITDWGNNRLIWYDADGSLLSVKADLGLQKPYDAQILGSQMVVADAHNGRVLFNKMI
jgi:hypothetical protein